MNTRRKVFLTTPAWLDMLGITDPGRRARELAKFTYITDRPEPKPRVISQRALDTQTARRAKERYKQQIKAAKAKAAEPLRGPDRDEIEPDPKQPRLI